MLSLCIIIAYLVEEGSLEETEALTLVSLLPALKFQNQKITDEKSNLESKESWLPR